MSTIEKLIRKLNEKPIRNDLTIAELKELFEAIELKGGRTND